MASTRPNRFRSFNPLRTSIRTAFSPTRSISSTSTSTTPLSRNTSPHSTCSTSTSTSTSIRDLISLRRKPSVLEFEIEEEKHLFSHELELLEPRPIVGFAGPVGRETHVVGIFEVLDGKC